MTKTSVIDNDPMTRHAPDMAAMIEYWNKVDDIMGGIDTMRAAGQRWFPKWPSEESDDYNFRLNNTKFTNIFSDIVESLASKPFEQEVSLKEEKDIKIPEQLLEFCENVDGSGMNLTGYAATTFLQGIVSAIDWIFVDYPTVDPEVIRTQADAKAANLRPFWTHVVGINVFEAVSKMVGGKEQLVYIRMYEPEGSLKRVRIIERVGDLITWKLYERREQQSLEEFRGEKTFYHKIAENEYRGISVIPLVPFITGRRVGKTFEIKPMMKNAADVQIEHYLQESGFKYVCKLAAYPMLVGEGVRPEMKGKQPEKIRTGPGVALYTTPNQSGAHGTWKYIEPAASSMKLLQDDIDKTGNALREIGRQPLTAQASNLTVITTAVAAGKAKTAVKAWALNLKNALENAMVITGMWLDIMEAEYSPQIYVFTDFEDYSGEMKEGLTEIGAARRAGDISHETYINELKRRKQLEPEVMPAEEMERILKERPMLEDDLDEDKPKPKPKA